VLSRCKEATTLSIALPTPMVVVQHPRRSILGYATAAALAARQVGALLSHRDAGRKVNGTIIASNSVKSDYDCYTGNGADYEGLKAMTKNGRPCKNWVEEGSISPTTLGIGNHNFCRNPQGSKTKPWCFTIDPAVEFDFCDVPECKPSALAPVPWVAPQGSKSPEEEAKGPCTEAASSVLAFTMYQAGRECMNHRSDTWWLITNSNFTAADASGCEVECAKLPGTEFFTYWKTPDDQGKNCGCYRQCILVDENSTSNEPNVYRMK